MTSVSFQSHPEKLLLQPGCNPQEVYFKMYSRVLDLWPNSTEDSQLNQNKYKMDRCAMLGCLNETKALFL